MDKATLQRLITFLPNDATEISIKGHDTTEVFFNSDQDYSQIALPAQRGTYTGPKKRWRMSEETLFRGTKQAQQKPIQSQVENQVQNRGTPVPPVAPQEPEEPEEQPVNLQDLPTAE